MTSEYILIVENDYPIAAYVQAILEREGYWVDIVAYGNQVLECIHRKPPNLIVLDLVLPGKNGLQLCAAIRQLSSYIPIIMLSAKDEVIDKVIGLEIGADDYMIKPFTGRELVARVRAIFRLVNGCAGTQKDILSFDSLEIDLPGRIVKRDGQLLNLTPTEFDLLELLASNPGRVFGRAMLMERIWGYQFNSGSRTVDVHIQRLRQRIELDPHEPRFLVTVRNIGYKFVK